MGVRTWVEVNPLGLLAPPLQRRRIGEGIMSVNKHSCCQHGENDFLCVLRTQ